MCLEHLGNALGRGYQAHEADVLAALCLEHGQRVNCRAAGCQHGVNQNNQSVLNIGRQLAVILYGLVRFGIAVKTDVPHLCNGNERLNTVHHAKTCAQNGYDGKLSAGYHFGVHFGNGSLDGHVLQRQITGQLVAHEHGDLVEQLAEILGARLFVTHDCKLMCDKRMVDQMKLSHDSSPLVLILRLHYTTDLHVFQVLSVNFAIVLYNLLGL